MNAIAAMDAAASENFFASLEAQMAAVPDPPSTPPAGPIERYLIWVGFLAAGVAIVVGNMVGGMTGLWVAGIGLSIEVAAFAAAFTLAVRRNWSSLRHGKRSFATDLDADYEASRRIVSWLGGLGRDQLELRRRYLDMRRGSLAYRLGVFSGGIEKLGPLPLLLVLYIQLKDVELGSWAALGQVTLVSGFLLAALASVYLLSMVLLGNKLRLEAYEYLIDEAIRLESG